MRSACCTPIARALVGAAVYRWTWDPVVGLLESITVEGRTWLRRVPAGLA